MPKGTSALPEWEQIISSAAHLQEILPEAVLVGGTAAAIYAEHRFSTDADHVLTNLKEHFDDVLAQLESVAGWKTARIRPPVQILGSLEGIETGVRQLIREQPLETVVVERFGYRITIPTIAEMLRIKAVLILKRNATRDYLDFAALADRLSGEGIISALRRFDVIYPQENGESALQQLQVQLASPAPFDLEEVNLAEYKNLVPKWREWASVQQACLNCAVLIFDRILAREEE